jgi:hypothetical protein
MVLEQDTYHFFPSAFGLQPPGFKAFGFDIFIVKCLFLRFNGKK